MSACTNTLARSRNRSPVPLWRFALAWAVMVGGLVGFWCIRPWLGTNAFNFGQFAVLVATLKIASLLCLPTKAWARFTPLRFLAYCVWSECSLGSFSWASGPPPMPRFPLGR